MKLKQASVKTGRLAIGSQKLTGKKICRLATVPFFLLTQLKNQSEYLKNIGMDIMLVSSDGIEVSNLTASGLDHTAINIPRSISILQDLRALFALWRLFRCQCFDIVHSTTPKAGLLAALAGIMAGISVRLHTFTGQQWLSQTGFTRFISRLADRLIGLLNTRCYADSHSQRQFLVREGLVDPKKIYVIGHGSLAGVDMVRFNPNRWSQKQKESFKQKLSISLTSIVLIFMGRITKEKGILELLAAFSKIRSKDKYEVELLLLGPQDDERGGSNGIEPGALDAEGVHYIGYSDSPEKYIAISDLLCLPSYREGFGTVVIEAAAMGVATLGTRINGLIDAVADGQSGMLVPPRSERAIYNALCFLLERPHGINRLGEAARLRALNLFDASIVNAMVAEEYCNLING